MRRGGGGRGQGMRGGETGLLCLQTRSGRVQQEFKGEIYLQNKAYYCTSGGGFSL